MSAKEVGRNDACPCGSGAKYKRCCLSRCERLVREVARLEAAVDELGRWLRSEHRDAYLDAFADFYSGGWQAFGIAGPDRDERLAADLWLTCDVAMAGGSTALAAAGPALLDAEVIEALEGSALRVWRVEAVRGAGMIEAACLASGQHCLLETVRPPRTELAPDALVVARSVSLGRDRFALLGHPVVVASDAREEFEELFWEASCDERDVSRLWRDFGGRFASAALGWPEDREHTRDGEIVCDTHVAFDLTDVGAMVSALDDAVDFHRTGQEFWDSDTIAWHWRAAQPMAPAVSMPDERGVRWSLCEEDAQDPPIDARVECNPEEQDVWLFAPGPDRLARCEKRFAGRFAGLLTDATSRGSDIEEIVPKWRRERWERSLGQLERAMRHVHRRLAA